MEIFLKAHADAVPARFGPLAPTRSSSHTPTCAAPRSARVRLTRTRDLVDDCS